MEIIRISHLGLAPKNTNQALEFFNNILGMKHISKETIDSQKVEVDILQCENSQIELLKPTQSTSPITKFLEKKGSGIHHIAFQVDSIDEWLKHLKKNNIQLIDEFPRRGAHNTKIIFIHPNATSGILVELVEETK